MNAKRTSKRARNSRIREARRSLWSQIRRGAFWPFKSCPTPGIEAYRTNEEARVATVAIMRYSRRSVYARSAKCQCGFWHIHVESGEIEWED